MEYIRRLGPEGSLVQLDLSVATRALGFRSRDVTKAELTELQRAGHIRFSADAAFTWSVRVTS
jgi:hypothetical protein